MEYIIGGILKNPNEIIDEAKTYFKDRFNTEVNYTGISRSKLFYGVIHRKSESLKFTILDDSSLFKSYYPENIREIKESIKNNSEAKDLAQIPFDFIYIKTDLKENLKVYVDKFNRQKIYYTKKEPFLFSSSLKFLLHIYKKKEINYKALCRLINYGVNIGNETVFSYINRLHIGEYIQIADNKLVIDKYWKIKKEFLEINDHNIDDLSFWIEFIFKNFKDAIDWPVKTSCMSLLSGGIDSTVLTSILVKHHQIPLEALTLKMPGFNERDVQKACIVAEDLDIPHTIIEIKDESPQSFINNHSEIFNVLEEPVLGSGYISRYRAFKETKALNKEVIFLGDGGDDALGYNKPDIIKNMSLINKIYRIPLKIRSFIIRVLRTLYKPSLSLIEIIKKEKLVYALNIITNKNFLQSQNEFQSYFSTFQTLLLEEIKDLTKYYYNLDEILKPIFQECNSYPYDDRNKYGYHRMISIADGDASVNFNIANITEIKPYTLISNDIFWKRMLPLPESVKLLGNRERWIIYEMARKKKLLPEAFFKDPSYHGFHQVYEEKNTFDNTKAYLKNLIYSKGKDSLIPLKPYEKYINITYNDFKKYLPSYAKFSVSLGILGWFFSII